MKKILFALCLLLVFGGNAHAQYNIHDWTKSSSATPNPLPDYLYKAVADFNVTNYGITVKRIDCLVKYNPAINNWTLCTSLTTYPFYAVGHHTVEAETTLDDVYEAYGPGQYKLFFDYFYMGAQGLGYIDSSSIQFTIDD